MIRWVSNLTQTIISHCQINFYETSYRPQRSCVQGNIFTPVCHSFCPQGGLPQCMLGYHPPQEQNPPWEQTLPPGAYSPPEQTPPSRSRQPPGADTPLLLGADPLRSRHPPSGKQTPAYSLRTAATHPIDLLKANIIRNNRYLQLSGPCDFCRSINSDYCPHTGSN